MHASQAVPEQQQWRPNAAWIALAVYTVLFSLGTNFYEFLGANVLHAIPVLVSHPVDRLLDDGARLLMCGVGLVILLRSKGRRSTCMLGVGLAALSGFPVDNILADSTVRTVLFIAFQFNTSVLSFLIAAFAISMLQESAISVPRFVGWLFWVSLALAVAIWITPGFGYVPVLSDGLEFLYYGRFALVPFLLSMGLLLLGWFRASGDVRQRFFLLFLAVSVIISGNMLFSVFYNDNGIFPRPVTNSASALRITGSLLFAYAILKHRVIDIGFTINRTLVYGSVSLILLATFGLLEWGVHHLLEIEGKESSPLIDAALAVSIFLAFHPVRDFVEHYVERWFFSSWQQAEMQLKRFVASAGHFNSKQTLCEAFAKELSHYAEGAETALYTAQAGGAYRLTSGSLTEADEHYEDNPAFALMRSEREPIDLTHGNVALPGALALPMLDQGVLIGFALLAGKPDGSHYRPDELENLGWAAHQVGLDLQALHARELEAEVTELKSEVTQLRSEVRARDRILDRLSPQT